VYETGVVNLGEGLAKLQVPDGFKYLDTRQARYVLETIWGNPPSDNLGMLIPRDVHPYEDGCWAITIEYDESGYVEDKDAADIDYDDLLKEMQQDALAANEERTKGGYQAIELKGWALKPYYDAQAHKLHWAKELQFIGDSGTVLNYNIRVLGRKGVLVLNAIAGMDQLPLVNASLPTVLPSVEFTEDNRYENFDAGIDKVAAYGIGGLIAGKVLAKVGFFALLLKFWKIIALGVIAVFAALRNKIFGRKDKVQPATVEASSSPAEPHDPGQA
jgi:uncharacterized membrane-anchored protein